MMTAAEVFSSALLLKGGDRMERILALLDEDKAAEVRIAMERLTSMPLPNVRQLWNEGRKAEECSAVKAAQAKFGFEQERLSPALVNWLVRKVV